MLIVIIPIPRVVWKMNELNFEIFELQVCFLLYSNGLLFFSS